MNIRQVLTVVAEGHVVGAVDGLTAVVLLLVVEHVDSVGERGLLALTTLVEVLAEAVGTRVDEAANANKLLGVLESASGKLVVPDKVGVANGGTGSVVSVEGTLLVGVQVAGGRTGGAGAGAGAGGGGRGSRGDGGGLGGLNDDGGLGGLLNLRGLRRLPCPPVVLLGVALRGSGGLAGAVLGDDLGNVLDNDDVVLGGTAGVGVGDGASGSQHGNGELGEVHLGGFGFVVYGHRDCKIVKKKKNE